MGKGGDALTVQQQQRKQASAGGLTFRKLAKNEGSEEVGKRKGERRITREELGKHTTEEDCWLSIRGSVRRNEKRKDTHTHTYIYIRRDLNDLE